MAKKTTLGKSIWHFSAPKYWPTWTGLAFAWSLSRLPWRCQLWLGKLAGRLLYRVAARRRHICQTNLKLCYPDAAEQWRQQLAKDHFDSMGIGLFETMNSWFYPAKKWSKSNSFSGGDLLEEALSHKRGCIIIGGHFSPIDLCGSQLALHVPVHPIYKLQSNPVLNWVMERQRHRTYEKTIERSNMREVLKSLKDNKVVWYAVDQDYGRKHSVFAPFFGTQCATIAHIGRIAQMTNAPVLLYDYARIEDHYRLRLLPVDQGFPGTDEVVNAEIMNRLIEQLIDSKKEQYFWTHRRFKTRPNPDDTSLYSN